MAKTKSKLPLLFKPLFWSYNFSAINPKQHQKEIIVQTINYGNWEQWQWLVKYYGKKNLRRVIQDIPASEFRKRALDLVKILFNIKKLKYASRSNKIRKSRNI